jgi:hypothetical protein
MAFAVIPLVGGVFCSVNIRVLFDVIGGFFCDMCRSHCELL